MKIARFLDTEGRPQLGVPRGDGQAEILTGDFFGDLSEGVYKINYNTGCETG